MTPNQPNPRSSMRGIAQTLKGTYSGAWGFLKGKAEPSSAPPVGGALGVLKDPHLTADITKSGGGTPPSPPFTPGQWMKLAINSVMSWGGERTTNIDLMPAPYPTADSDFNDPRLGRRSGPDDDKPSHDQSVVSAARVIQFLLARFDPVYGLTPRRLQEYLQQWQLGFLRWLAILWSQMRERDDQIKSVEAKRIFAVARLEHEVMSMDSSPEAQAHKEALEAFYDNLTCADVLEQNKVGGVHLMIRQQMSAVGYKFAVHEIVWRPYVDETGKDRLTARLRFVPIWFFENRTGVLRYLPYELALDGIPLDAGGWMVTVADGLMVATSIAYMYKQLALKSWVNFADKFGIPMLIGKTTAAFNSTEWQQFQNALQYWRSDGAALFNSTAVVESCDTKGAAGGETVQERLTDRMDRAVARLWRGGDLSTMSRGGSGAGALPQMEQEDELCEADAINCSEACNFYIDRWVIKYLFGVDKPKAYLRIIPPLTTDTAKEIAVDQFLISMGVKLATKDALERYGRRSPDPDDDLLKPPAPTMGGQPIGKGIGDGSPGGPLSLGNAAVQSAVFRASAMRELTKAQAEALVPLADRIHKASLIEDDAARAAACAEIKKDLPTIFKSVATRSGELVTALEKIVGTALISGATQAAAGQSSS